MTINCIIGFYNIQRNNIINAAIPGRPFLNDSDDARNTPAEPYRDLLIDAGAEVRVHDPHVLQYPDVEVSQGLDAVLDGVDAVVVFAGHKQYYSLEPQQLQELSGQTHPVIVDGRNVVEPDAFIDAGFVYEAIFCRIGTGMNETSMATLIY